jgi:hypothetical protein
MDGKLEERHRHLRDSDFIWRILWQVLRVGTAFLSFPLRAENALFEPKLWLV